MSWNLTSVLLLVGAFLLGYGIGLGEMYWRQSRKISRLQEELQKKETALNVDIAPPIPASALRLWFDAAQTVNLELDGARLDAPGQITPAQRRRLIDLLNRLRPWVEGQPRPAAPPPPAAAVPPSPPAPAPAPAAPARVPPLAPPSAPVATVEKPAAAMSIVEQIDEILQRLLASTPFAGQVRLREQVGGGIDIWVGAKRYTAVDEVAEAEVKAALRAAIAEWERHA